MSEEKVLAILLVAGSGLILILTIAIICIIMKRVNTKTKNTTSHSEIPMSNMNQQYHNYGVQHEGNTTTTNNNQTKTTENPDNGQHKAEWPSNYNMYAVSRSYAFPKTAEPVKPSNGSRPASIISTKSYEISHKTFSEEVFEGLKQATHPTASVSSAGTSDHKRPHSGVWKYHHHTPSQTPSQHSMDKTSIASSSTASHPPEYYHSDEKQQSYYSTFKSKKARSSLSREMQASQNGSNNATTTLTTKIFTQSQRERISSQTVDPEGEKKVFTFSIK